MFILVTHFNHLFLWFTFHQEIISSFIENFTIFFIIFLFSGIVINAIGGFLIKLIDYIYNPRWHKPDTEIKYWRDIDGEKEFTRNKIDRRWNFFTTNLNSFIAILLSCMFTILVFNFKCMTNVGLIVLFSIVLTIFMILTNWGYKSMLVFDENL